MGLRAPAPRRPRSRASGSLLGTAARLLPGQTLMRAGEALFPVLLAAWFGSTAALDGFMRAWAAFTFAGAFVVDVHRDAALIPVLAQVRAHAPARAGALLAAALRTSLAASFVVGSAVALGLTALAPTGATGAWMVPATLAVYLPLASTRALLSAIANAGERYQAPAAAGALAIGLVLGTGAVLRSRLGVNAIALGMAVGELAACALLWPLARAEGLRLHARAAGDPGPWFGELLRASGVLVLGNAMARLGPLVDQLFAARAATTGAGTHLRLAADVALAPGVLLQASVLPVLLTRLAQAAADSRPAEVTRLTRQALGFGVAVMSVAALLVSLAAAPVLRLVYRHGHMTEIDVRAMVPILYGFAAALPGLAATLVLARAHVALSHPKALLFAGAANAVLNTGLNWVLLGPLGTPGLAWSTALTTTAVAALMGLALRRPLRALATAPLKARPA